ncbi:hypothetical protein [Mucisphaera sp.]|uniref:hypothetical protein n=1 Tax=Mucisphaera sp. TaxID=2913024 RepID=UPI003D10AD86
MKHWTFGSVAVVFAAVCVFAVPGCRSGGEEPVEDLPTIGEIRSTVTPPGPPGTAPSVQRPGSAIQLSVMQIGLTIDAGLDAAWSAMSAESLSPSVAERWARNGLRVGVMPADTVTEWVAGLPLPTWPMGRRRAVIQAGGMPILETGRLSESVAVDLGGLSAEMTNGPLMVDAMLREGAAGRSTAVLVPSVPDVRGWLMRGPVVDALDHRRVFDSLALPLAASGQTALVFGLTEEARERVLERLELGAAADERALPMGVALMIREKSGVVWQRVVVLRAVRVGG